MRRAPLLALILLAGCVWPGLSRPDGPSTSLKPVTGRPMADAVGLEVALLEVPVGDRYANGGLWASVDEQVVALERKAALDDNGFRIGIIGGVRPSEFDDLLKSPRSNPTPHWLQTRAGRPKLLPIGGPRPLCEFHLLDGNKPATVAAFEQAQCALQITPTPAAEGAVKLAFVPLVQHGSRPVWSAPLDGEEPAIPAERYPALGWEVTVAAGEFVLVGTRYEKAGTLGHAFLMDLDGTKPVQRLLTIRAARTRDLESGVRSQ
ncbi:MAG TPA: hypothetical protein VH120_14300 [Gemmataceae bacterium]|jgi:hypothetical protein|nr:hypothetical protein [Gemmataceae bacterium]